jgi:hypothetical protein
MSNKELQQKEAAVTASIIIDGDLSRLHPSDKVLYYRGYCERLGLDPFTKPFDLLRLQGREVLYLTRSGAQQLNKMHGVSHQIISRELMAEPGIFQVIARATLPDGRFTESMSAVSIANLKGEQYCNALMKAETKAKRRSTLDLLGLGILSEEEAVPLPGERVEIAPPSTPDPIEVYAEKEPFNIDIAKAVVLQYDEPDAIVEVLKYVTTVAHLNALYQNNKAVVESSGIRPMFSDRKKFIQSQS